MKHSQQVNQDSEIYCFPQKRPRLTYNSTSSSSNDARIKYDVFISFRGPDSRSTFLSHLVEALKRKQIEVFVDYKLRKGDEISPTLLKAIEESQISLVIFSEDYASSKYCLDELVKINKCRKENGQIVIPIFYKVDPSCVRYQKGSIQDSFARHEERYKFNTMKWRTTMKEVADLSGLTDKEFRTEAKLVEEVVQRVLARLKITMHKFDIKGLLGIDKSIADLLSIISRIKSEDVGVIGICGMGGLGKTTIAHVLFNTMLSEFEGYCFLENVREQIERDGITRVRSKIISTLLEENDQNLDISSAVPNHVLRRLQRKKSLIVLDDAISNNLIEKNWLGPGSIIIVTTRDKHVIQKEVGCIYEVKALESHDALELLKLHAFDENWPQMNWHGELMKKVLEYGKGIPLALKVLGSLLCGTSAEEWESELEKLQTMPCADIQNVLKLSHEGLDRDQQNIFLCLACFFSNYDWNVKELLDASCDRCTAIDLKTLENKALITVPRDCYGKVEEVTMHDLIREMGRSIEKPGERKHLWDHREICHVLQHGQGSEHIESINLNMEMIDYIKLSPDCFAKMFNLKFLRHMSNKLHLPRGLEILPSDIRLFDWEGYPSKVLTSSI